MAIDFQRAGSFVATHGSALERARLDVLTGGRPPTTAVEAIVALQNEDGGFPYAGQAGAPSTLHHTAHALQWLTELRLINSTTTAQAVAFIVHRQIPRGIWRESYDLLRETLPLWMDPESTAADIYTTALCASALVSFEQASIAVDRAVVWLQTQQGRDGLLQGFKVHASYLALPVFAEQLGADSRATRRLVAGLGKTLNNEWTAAMIATLLLQLLSADYGLQTEVVARAWTMVQRMQEPDGSFAGDDEPDSSVETTLKVLRSAHLLGYDITER